MFTTIVKFMVGHLVFAMMLGLGLTAQARELLDIKRRPTLYIKALFVMWLAVPLLAIVTVTVLRLHTLPSELILLMAVCPGAPFIPSSTKREGDAYSSVGLNLLLLTSLMAPFFIPPWLSVLSRAHPFTLAISPAQVLMQTIPTVIGPLCAGLAIRHWLPRVADALARPVRCFFYAALGLVVVVALWRGAPVIVDVVPRVLVAIVIMVAGSTALGAWAGKPVPADRRTTGLAAALGNPGLALSVLAVSYPDFKATAFMLGYVILRKLALLPFDAWFKHRAQHDKTPERPSTSTPQRGHRPHSHGSTPSAVRH
jgi:BASS family bile acid:Na+ symporter